MSLLRRARLLAAWFFDWLVLPWLQPDPGRKRDKREDGGQSRVSPDT